MVDKLVQGQNKRNNHLVTAHSETLCVAEWARRAGIDGFTLRARLKSGLTPEEAVSARRRDNVLSQDRTGSNTGCVISVRRLLKSRVKRDGVPPRRCWCWSHKHKAVPEGKE